MKMHELARLAAEDRHSDLHRELSARPPLNAVIECAHRAGTIGEVEYNTLLQILPDQDFSAFVANSGPLVQRRSAPPGAAPNPIDERFAVKRVDVKDIPPDAFLAFIRVENPKGKSILARRHLIHPMISLGEGKAAGNHVEQIGVHTNSPGWTIIDLDQDLIWIDVLHTNNFDFFSRIPLGLQQVQLLRLRYRETEGAVSPAALRGTWGYPDPSATLRARIVDAAAKLTKIEIDASTDRPGAFRVNFAFELDRDGFEAFFNGPDELRGHYYADATIGDTYTRDLLTAIADGIDWQQMLADKGDDQYFGISFNKKRVSANATIFSLIKASMREGKIWYKEKKGNVQPHGRWQDDWAKDASIYHFRPNSRWIGREKVSLANWHAFLADTRADDGHLGPAQFQALQNKLETLGAHYGRSGASYYKCLSPAETIRLAETSENLDVKGQWLNARGESADFTPSEKLFRGHQIKWFGFT